MREIINLSLPRAMAKSVDDIVKEGSYASRSEFFRELLRMWMEGKILKELAVSQREIAVGKGKILKSLKDLR
ncbi:MAG: ribbon-helix-helix domain-containing protein [Candidatus Gribaldobacteria bacterium]|nr:ribbon-helix-helix domain-containing protein [Candidatus Gribaldobacteria bacterium]